MDDTQRKAALDRIRQNIDRHGHHLYVVSGGPEPRFAYTIGLRGPLGLDLVFAGGSFYSTDEVIQIVNDIVAKVRAAGTLENLSLEISSLGSFSLRKVHSSWAKALMLGALDFYGVGEVSALQVVPDGTHWTTDVPNLSEPWNADAAPAWRWLKEPWTYPVPADSVAVTNLGALRGDRITEAMRWEEGEWELFAGAGPDVPREEIRKVPLGTLLATDDSLVPVVQLPTGRGLWRDVAEWHPWGTPAQAGGQNEQPA